MEEVSNTFIRKQYSLAESLIREFKYNYSNKAGRALTEEETFAIAYCSGVKCDTKMERTDKGYDIKFSTVPAAVRWIDNNFQVFMRSNL